MTKVCDHLAVSIDEVRRNFAAYGLLDDQVQFLKGWFSETLPGAPIERLALMRLDGDLYESTRDALVNLYDRLSPGGYVIVDDYGEDSWTYCRRAVDEFRAERGIQDPLVRVDSRCYFWQTTRSLGDSADLLRAGQRSAGDCRRDAMSLISLEFAAFVALSALLFHAADVRFRPALLCVVSVSFCALNSIAAAVALLLATREHVLCCALDRALRR